MANGKRILRLTAIVIALVGVLGFQMEAMGMFDAASDDAGRPDVIMIDTIAKLESLNQPAVVFEHDLHTKALKDQGMSCESCHKKDAKGNLTLAFDPQEDGDRADMSASKLKDMYHNGCISCHVKSEEKGFKTGPKTGECRSCHQERPEAADRVPAGMDNMLHYVHWNSPTIPADKGKDTNCGACHKKAGEEDSWRFSEAAKTEPLKDVFHSQCVTCHESLIEKKADRSGPVQCAGCHGEKQTEERAAEMAKTLKAMGDTVPRLPRKQPDAALMFHGEPGKVEAVVAFNHKAHEGVTDSCLACHVDGVNAPVDKSYVAMHDETVDASCVGCHIKEQAKPECAGCHAARSTVKQPSEATCGVCHTKVGDDLEPALTAEAPKEMKQAIAQQLIDIRSNRQTDTVAIDDIPDVVTIGTISDKYQPSKMPHRKIVLKLMDGMKDNPLASAFHTAPKAICSGCHHNSPAYATPKCSSCHTKTDGNRPSLKAAYHGQCMDCHKQMKLEKPASTNCVACHEKKTN